MIKALRITIAGNIPYQNVEIYRNDKQSGFPDFFEDYQIAFRCKDGTFVLSDYQISIIQLCKGRVSIPKASKRVKRVLISGEMSYEDCYVIEQSEHMANGIPQIFRPYEQFAFITKDGLFVAPDFQVLMVQL